MTPPRIVLIGPPGSGKSTVGRAIAKKSGLEWIDTDKAIERIEGKSITDIFAEGGESVFREIERREVAKALLSSNTVVSLGGGAILDTDTQADMRKLPLVIFLDVSISNAAPRVGLNKERPLLMINPRQQWMELMKFRRPIYESLATLTLSTNNRKAEEVAAEILEWMEK